MESKSFSFKKIVVGILFAAFIAAGVYYKTSCASNAIIDYDERRDTREMVDLFERNLYWLTVRDDSSSFKFYLRHRTPNEDPFYFGKMNIKVLHQNNELVGFITYYMDGPSVGKVLYIAVNEKHRGKRYGQKLLEYALEQLKAQGAQKIKLVTRPSNLSGHALYKRTGFVETHSDDTFSYFTYFVK